jgi:hypothetical protein
MFLYSSVIVRRFFHRHAVDVARKYLNRNRHDLQEAEAFNRKIAGDAEISLTMNDDMKRSAHCAIIIDRFRLIALFL